MEEMYLKQENIQDVNSEAAIVCGEAFKNDVVVKILDANPLPNSQDPIIE